ncbi:MAG: hypothetical protein ABI026_05905 [Gemmatimonadaceae bacterium]
MRYPTQAGRRIRATTCGVAAAVLSLVACGGKDAPAAATDTTGAVVPGAAAPDSSVATVPATPKQLAADQHSMATYPLTVDHVTRVTEVMRRIHSLEQSDPALKAEWEKAGKSTGPTTIDQVIARIGATPRAPEILKGAGISAHDYVYTTFALMYASAAYQMQKSGQSIKSAKLISQVSPANIAFVSAHQKEIAALAAVNGASGSGRQK